MYVERVERGRGRGHYGNEVVVREGRRERFVRRGRARRWHHPWWDRKRQWELAYPGVVFSEPPPADVGQPPDDSDYTDDAGDAGGDASVSAWYNVVGKAFTFPPRNGLQERGQPTRSDREILPMSTGGTKVPFGVSAQITSRPQRVAFRAERVMISNGGTAGGAADWIVNDISIGNRSQFAQSGQVPGDMFAINAVDSFISFETAQTAMDIVITVTYVGANVDPGSCAFYGSILGTSALY